MTSHPQSSTRLNAQRTPNALSLLDARSRSRRRWAFALALGLNVCVWKAIASLPQPSGQGSSPGAIEWSRVEVNSMLPDGETLKLAAPAPKSSANAVVQRDLSLVAPQAPREPRTRIARRILPVPNAAPQRSILPQRVSPVVRETPPVRHNPDLEPPPPQANRLESNQPDETRDVRSTESQRATWTTPSSTASSSKASEYDRLPPAEQTSSAIGSATQSANTSRENAGSSTRSANMTAAPSSDASNSFGSQQRSGTNSAIGFRDGSSRNGASSSESGEKRGDASSEGGPGKRSNSRMSAPDARMRELPNLEPRPTPRREPNRTPRPEPHSTPREEPRPIATPRPQETPRRAEERPQPTPEPIRNVEKPRRSTEVREARADRIVKPRVPKRLRRQKRRLSVGVDVDIDEAGRATPRLRESSGDGEMDEEALKAARKTRWKPRAEDGKATKSTQRMRYDVDVKDGAGNDDAGEEEE